MKKARSRRTRIGVITGLVALVLLLVGWSEATTPVKGPHSALELMVLRDQLQGLDVQFGTYFVSAGRCAGCHGHDSLGIAMITEDGEDVNVVDDWRSSMMANSARDPFFLAKMEHEGLVNPAHKEEIEYGCLKCHAPLAVFERELTGAPDFSMAQFDTSVFAQDGVSCLACHMLNPDSAGRHFSGELYYDSARVWGPYTSEQINPAIMQFFVGFTPDQGSHILDGRVCAGCHTAVTPTKDLDGNPTGGSFFEQTLWQEFKNSAYYGTDRNCRSCHMPRINDPVILASEYVFLEGRSPFGKHHLVGGNTFMLQMLKDHSSGLGVPATSAQFDSSIVRSRRMLRDSTLQLSVEFIERTTDTLAVDVHLANLTGHKFPGGFPNRRAFVQVVAITGQGDTLFQSGRWDDTYEVIGNDIGFEPHHDVITQDDQVQIYELVMGDVNGNVTTTLHRAATPLKDDRLVPLGFSTSHPSYDTIVIVGSALSDPDFNHDALGIEGNGGDIVHYRMPTNGHAGVVSVKASVFFQAVPPRWNQEMFSHHGPRIDTFRTMYENADGTPELVASDSLMDVGTGVHTGTRNALRVFPNPTSNGVVTISGAKVIGVKVFDAKGTLVQAVISRTAHGWRCVLPASPGVYHLVISTPQGNRLERVIRSTP